MNRIEALQRQQLDAAARVAQVSRELERARKRVRSVESSLAHAQSDAPVLPHRDATCGVCGADVRTERLFSEHYVITDYRYANLGHCPNRGGDQSL